MALSKVDAVDPETLKTQMARLKRAAKRTPLGVSSVSGAGMPQLLGALLSHIDSRRAEAATEERPAWQP